MKVKCPSCGAQYSLDPTKIPAGGAKVRCPSCSHTFVVRVKQPAAPAAQPSKPAPAASPPSPSMGTGDEPIALDAEMPSTHVTGESESSADVHGISSADFDMPAAPQAPKVAPKPVPQAPTAAPKPASAAPPPPPKPAAAPPPPKPAAPAAPQAAAAESLPPGAFTGEGQWRVKKSGLGLVYGPADFSTIQSWVRAERVGRQDQYSLDGGPWRGPGEFEIIAKQVGIPYTGPVAPVTPLAAAVPKAPEPPRPVPQPAAPRPAPVAASVARPRGGGDVSLGFELPDDGLIASDEKKGGSLGKVLALAFVLLLVGAGGGGYFALTKPELREKVLPLLPPAAQQKVETFFGRRAERIAAKKAAARPDDPLTALGKRIPQDYLQRYQVTIKNLYAGTAQDFATAVSVLEGIRDSAPGEAVALRTLLNLVETMAVYRGVREGNLDELLLKAQSYQQASPNEPIALDGYALALLAKGRAEEAATLAAQSLERNGADPIAFFILAMASPPGVDRLRKALELRPDFNAASLELARALYREGDRTGGDALVEVILGRTPEHEGAKALRDAPPLPGTAGADEPEVDTEAADASVLYEQARSLFEQQNYGAAEKIFIALLRDRYEDLELQQVALTHFYLAETYRVTDRNDLAKIQYEASLEVAPNFAKARQRLDSLVGKPKPAQTSVPVRPPAADPAVVSPPPQPSAPAPGDPQGQAPSAPAANPAVVPPPPPPPPAASPPEPVAAPAQ